MHHDDIEAHQQMAKRSEQLARDGVRHYHELITKESPWAMITLTIALAGLVGYLLLRL